jgi:biotin carboxyl carrier protein
MSANGNNSQVSAVSVPSRRPSNIWLIIVAALFIIVPFLTWYLTWFGRTLSDDQIAAYLAEEKNPRHVQHALAQIEQRIEKRDPTVKKFYPQILGLTKSPTGEIRKTAAWLMGQDNSSEEFHRALNELLQDSEPLVRRNAALQLVRFGDAAGRAELRAMLQPFPVRSAVAGTVFSVLPVGSKISAGGLLARIRDSVSTVQEFRSPVDGVIGTLAVKEGETVSPGQTLVLLKPDRATVNDALRALAFVGTPEDLQSIEAFAGDTANESDLRQIAFATAKSIRGRTGQ